MSIAKELAKKYPNLKLNINALEGYKHEKLYIEKATKRIALTKKLYPDYVDEKYVGAFEHGFIEASVDAYEEIKKLKAEITTLKS